MLLVVAIPAPPLPVAEPEPPVADAADQIGLYPVPVKQFLALAAGLVLLVLITRVPLVSTYLLNWDAGNYALGLDYFNIARHQPHPPGYPVYIAAGRLLRLITGDANAAFNALSVTASALAAVALAGLTILGRFEGVTPALVVLPPGTQELIILDVPVSATDDQRVIERLMMPLDSLASVSHVEPGDHLLMSHKHAVIVQHNRPCPTPHTTPDVIPDC